VVLEITVNEHRGIPGFLHTKINADVIPSDSVIIEHSLFQNVDKNVFEKLLFTWFLVVKKQHLKKYIFTFIYIIV